MKYLFLILLSIIASSCSTNKVLYERECKFVCINQFNTYEEIDARSCVCEKGLPSTHK